MATTTRINHLTLNKGTRCERFVLGAAVAWKGATCWYRAWDYGNGILTGHDQFDAKDEAIAALNDRPRN